MKGLTEEEGASYERDGFFIVENLFSKGEVEGLLERFREYTHGDRDRGAIRFRTEPRVERGELEVDHPGDGIRKVDGLVEGDDRFLALGTHPAIVSKVESVLGPDIKMFRNSLLAKPPGVGSAKGFHQDSPYWPIEPMALISCWFALDDTDEENGCMQVLPGGHKRGPLPHVRVTDDLVIDPEVQVELGELRVVPISAGTGIFFHSLLPHYTSPNCSERWRRAIALSYMSAKYRYTREGPGPEYFQVKGQSFPGCV